MNCEAVKELLWMYLEKETTAEEAETIEKHLAECAACREEMEAQKDIMESLANLPDEELPEGFHTELMQKLQAEAVPNVVPFPVKKKKQPMFKQWGMIAAAVLMIAAAGGMNGMLEMRESQNEAVQQMKAAPKVASLEETTEVTMDMAAEVQEDVVYKSKKMNAPAAGMQVAAEAEETTAAYDPSLAAVPEMASVEDSIQFSVTRTVAAEAADQAVLQVADTAVAIAELQKAIAEAGGFEEAAEEGSVVAVIPVENYDGFIKVVEGIGTLTWTEQGEIEDNAVYHTVKIELK